MNKFLPSPRNLASIGTLAEQAWPPDCSKEPRLSDRHKDWIACMFLKGTVFVIGAGASVEFNLPTGAALKQQIATRTNLEHDGLKLTKGDIHLLSCINLHCKQQGKQVNNLFTAALRISEAMPQHLSIDNFLDAHEKDDDIKFVGKLAIARCILEAERQSILFSPNYQGKISSSLYQNSWLIPFAQRLFEGCKAENLDSVFDGLTFVVFNYDRCLEKSLMHILQNSFFVDQGAAASIISNAKIYHPYGSLGRLPWQIQANSSLTCDFGENANEEKYIQISDQIRTFTEQIDDSDLIDNVRSACAEATRFVFLGYAYHELNMKLLGVENRRSPHAFGTAYGMSISDQVLSQKLIRHSFPGSMMAGTDIIPTTCKSLLDDFGRAICYL